MEVNLDLETRYQGMQKQLDFILDNHFQTALYGGLGNGKTDAACWKAVLLSLLYPDALGLIGRATYPELKDSTIRSFFSICPEELINSYDRNNHELKMKNGAQIIFRAFDDPDKVKSINLGWFVIDQLEEISEDLYLMLLGRLRHSKCRFAVGVGNPQPGWVKRRFKDNNGVDQDIVLYEATTMENPHLPEDYIKNLVKNYPDFWVKRYVYGEWNTFEGQVFSEFHEKFNVIDPFELRGHKIVYFLDYGMRNPTAVLKFAIDSDENYYVVDEHYEAGKIISYHSQKIREMGYTRDYPIYFDPSTNAKNREKNGLIVSIQDEYRDNEIYPISANNEMAGLLRANQMFKDGQLKIFRNCTNTIREVTELRWKKVKASFDGNLPETEEDRNNHCFVANTSITMDDCSSKNIQDVSLGDKVMTSKGVYPVIKSWMTRPQANIWRLYLSNGTHIDGTKDHRIFTSLGVKTLDCLQYKDIMNTCKTISYSMGRTIDGMEDITPLLAGVRMDGNGCMSLSGNLSMALCLSGIISITKTLTDVITQLRISIRSSVSNISSYMLKGISAIKNLRTRRLNNCMESENSLKHGMVQTSVESGIVNTQKNHGNIRSKLKGTVNSVVESMKHLRLSILSFVIPIVTKLTNDQSVWVIGVRPLNIKAPVYNLTIDSVHEYYANGVLVANCTDCIKYFANSRVNAPRKPKDPNYWMVERENKLKKIGRRNEAKDWYNQI